MGKSIVVNSPMMGNRQHEKSGMVNAATFLKGIPLFPVSKPYGTRIERRDGGVTVSVTVGNPSHWAYGRTVRLIILYIQSKVLDPADPDVDRENHTVTLRGSFNSFCRCCGIANGTGTKDEVRNALGNLRYMFVTVTDAYGNHGECEGSPFASSCRMGEEDVMPVSIRFTDWFWRELTKPAAPLDMNIIPRLGRSARTLDIYLWVAHAMHSGEQLHASWQRLYERFENSGMAARNFKNRFMSSLDLIEDACPEPYVRGDDEGVTVYLSQSPEPDMSVVEDEMSQTMEYPLTLPTEPSPSDGSARFPTSGELSILLAGLVEYCKRNNLPHDARSLSDMILDCYHPSE